MTNDAVLLVFRQALCTYINFVMLLMDADRMFYNPVNVKTEPF